MHTGRDDSGIAQPDAIEGGLVWTDRAHDQQSLGEPLIAERVELGLVAGDERSGFDPPHERGPAELRWRGDPGEQAGPAPPHLPAEDPPGQPPRPGPRRGPRG